MIGSTLTTADFAVGKFVQTRRDCRQLVVNCVHTADVMQLDSCVASVVCIGHNDVQNDAVLAKGKGSATMVSF